MLINANVKKGEQKVLEATREKTKVGNPDRTIGPAAGRGGGEEILVDCVTPSPAKARHEQEGHETTLISRVGATEEGKRETRRVWNNECFCWLSGTRGSG